MGDFTVWLRPWLSILADPKTRLSQRCLVSAKSLSHGLSQKVKSPND